MTGVDIAPPFDQPYYEGDPEASSQSYLLPVGINGRDFLIDQPSRLYERRHVNLLRTRQNRQGSESLLTEPEIWRVIVESWHQGADQTRYDREDSLPYRFYSSRGIDVWKEWGISLLRDTAKIADLPDGKAHSEVLGNSSLLVAAVDQWLWWEDADLDPGTSLSGTFAAPVVDTTTDGENVYVLLNSGEVWKVPKPAPGQPPAPVLYATVSGNATMLAYLKGFLVVGDGNVLKDISGGTATTIYQHPLSGWRWRAGADGSGYAYVLGGMGDKWFVQKMSLLDDATTFSPPITAATLPEGEIGYALGGYLGYVLVGTDHGFRFAAPQGDGSLTYGRLVETAEPVEAFEGQDRFVWFGMSRTGAQPRLLDIGTSGLGRADLSTFTSPLTPAFASDLLTDLPLGRVGSISSVGTSATRLGRRIFTIDGVGVYRETDELVAEGFLDLGIVNMDAVDPKRAQYAQVTFEPLRGAVQIAFAWDSPDYVVAGGASTPDSTSMGNVLLDSRRFVSLAPRLYLTRDADDPKRGPRVTRLEVRAQVELGKAHEWTVPIIIAEQQTYEGVPEMRDPQEDFDFLASLVESGRQFQYREGARTWDCYAIGERWLPTHLTRDGKAWNGVYVISIRQVR